MKKRTLLTNIFIIVLMISIVFVLLAFFEIFGDGNSYLQHVVLTVSMAMALVSVLLVDIVFPLIDNISRFKKETSYKVKTIVKVVLFIVAVVFLLLTVKSIGIFKTQFLGIALFCVAYLAQFFIDLDRGKKAQIAANESDDEEDDDEDDNKDDEEDENENDDMTSFDDEDEFDNSYDNEDDIK